MEQVSGIIDCFCVEKLLIITFSKQNPILNKKSELTSKSRHEKKSLLIHEFQSEEKIFKSMQKIFTKLKHCLWISYSLGV